MAKIPVLKRARDLVQPFRPVEIAVLDGAYHAFIVRYSGDYIAHSHSADEFIYILEGHPTLCTDEGRTPLAPGMCAGFKAGTGNAHMLHNETAQDVVYLEVGDRTPGDEGSYPDDDLKASLVDGKWVFTHKDGTPYVTRA